MSSMSQVPRVESPIGDPVYFGSNEVSQILYLANRKLRDALNASEAVYDTAYQTKESPDLVSRAKVIQRLSEELFFQITQMKAAIPAPVAAGASSAASATALLVPATALSASVARDPDDDQMSNTSSPPAAAAAAAAAAVVPAAASPPAPAAAAAAAAAAVVPAALIPAAAAAALIPAKAATAQTDSRTVYDNMIGKGCDEKTAEKARIDNLWGSLDKFTNSLEWNYLPETQVNKRFINVDCVEKTAVGDKANRQYLHANWVTVNSTTFIASQAPMPTEREAFWSYCYHAGNIVIFDLTTPSDVSNNTPQYSMENYPPYYPGSGSVSITNFDERIVTITKRQGIEIPNIATTYHVVKGNELRPILRYNYRAWIDKNSLEITELDDLVNRLSCQVNTSKKIPLIHCSAGVGRTGTLITAYALKEKIVSGQITSRANLVEELFKLIMEGRLQRGPLFVQTCKQLDLLYQYAKTLLPPELKR